MSALGDRRFVARAALSLLVANVRHLSTVAPTVRREMRRWEQRALEIDDPDLRTLALEKLRGESFHAEAAAMLATLAPRKHREDVVEAIVALELLFDLLDGLTERPSAEPLHDGERLFAGYVNVLAPAAASETPDIQHDRYLLELSTAARQAFRGLPSAAAVARTAQNAAARGAEAQTRMHAASVLGTPQVEDWARVRADGAGVQWREFLAGSASSVLAIHALIAAAADPNTTHRDAIEIQSAYLSTCIVLTLLDGLVDHEQDLLIDAGRPRYIDFFPDRGELLDVLEDATQRAATQTRGLPNGPHHAMVLVGVVAYYSSDPGADSEFARPIVKRLRRELSPLIFPTLVLMRGWRLARRSSWPVAGLGTHRGVRPKASPDARTTQTERIQ